MTEEERQSLLTSLRILTNAIPPQARGTLVTSAEEHLYRWITKEES